MLLSQKTIALFGSVIVMTAGIVSSPTLAWAGGDGTLRVTVHDSNGAVVAGADVTVVKKGCACSDCKEEQKPCKCCAQQLATTGSEGYATFTVSDGVYNVRVQSNGFASAELDDVTVSAGQTQSCEITLKVSSEIVVTQDAGSKVGPLQQSANTASAKNDSESTSALSGRIVDENNHPLANVEIVLRNRGCTCDSCAESEKPCKCCISQRTMSDALGLYRIAKLTGGSYDVKVIKEGRTEGSFNGLEVAKETKANLNISDRAMPNQ